MIKLREMISHICRFSGWLKLVKFSGMVKIRETFCGMSRFKYWLTLEISSVA